MKNTEFSIWVAWVVWVLGLHGTATVLYMRAKPPEPPQVFFGQAKLVLVRGASGAGVEVEICLDGPAKQDVTVKLEVEDQQFIDPPDPVVIKAGETRWRWSPKVRSWPREGGKAAVRLKLTGADNARVGKPDKLVIELIDAAQPQVTLRAKSGRVILPAETIEFNVSLTPAANEDLTLKYEVSGDKEAFEVGSGTVQVKSKDDSATIKVKVVRPWDDSQPRELTVKLLSSSGVDLGSPAEARVEVQAPDRPKPKVTLLAKSARATLPIETIEFNVRVTPAAEKDLTVEYEVSGDEKVFEVGKRSVRVKDGATITVKVRPWDDSQPRELKVKLLSSSGVDLGSPKEARVEVQARPKPKPLELVLQADPKTLAEGKGDTVTLTAKLPQRAEQDVKLTWTFAGSAKPGVDYEEKSKETTIEKTKDTATVTLTVKNRDDLPPDRKIEVSCKAEGVKEPATATVTLKTDDSGRDVLLLVLATESLEGQWATRREELKKFVEKEYSSGKKYASRLVGGAPILVSAPEKWQKLDLGPNFPKVKLFNKDARINDEVNAALQVSNTLDTKTKARNNKETVSTFLLCASASAPEDRGVDPKDPIKLPDDRPTYFVWMGATADKDKVLDTTFKWKDKVLGPKHGVLYLMVNQSNDTLDKRLDGYLRQVDEKKAKARRGEKGHGLIRD